MRVGSPSEAELAMDMYLAGLLTCASTVRTTFPENRSSSGFFVRISAFTVAGQWRHLTALPLPDGVVIAPTGRECQSEPTGEAVMRYSAEAIRVHSDSEQV
jgi:hypothetical protein